jgi:large subunit ribosomal protein L21
MEYAVIQINEKQYIVEKGAVVKIDKLDKQEGDTVVFEKVPLYVNNDSVELGMPYVQYLVEGKVVKQARDAKKLGIRYQPGGYRKKYGHRQPMTYIEITDIKKT